jgi:hypothetical protein
MISFEGNFLLIFPGAAEFPLPSRRNRTGITIDEQFGNVGGLKTCSV